MVGSISSSFELARLILRGMLNIDIGRLYRHKVGWSDRTFTLHRQLMRIIDQFRAELF